MTSSRIFFFCIGLAGFVFIGPESRAEAWTSVWSADFESDEPGARPTGWWILGKANEPGRGVIVTDGESPLPPDPVAARLNIAGSGKGIFLFNTNLGQIARTSHPIPQGDLVRIDLSFAPAPEIGQGSVALGLVPTGERDFGAPDNRSLSLELRGLGGKRPLTVRVDSTKDGGVSYVGDGQRNLLQIVYNASPSGMTYSDLATGEKRELASGSADIYLNSSQIAREVPLKMFNTSLDLAITSFSKEASVGFFFDDIKAFHHGSR